MSIKNHKLTKKLQVLLTEDEVDEVNRLILNDALINQTRPVSVSAFIRSLIQKELQSNSRGEQESIVKKHINKLKEK
jgi:hypothetical protein